MIKPVRVAVDVPEGREDVYDFLDVMANHEPFTDHIMKNWQYSGPDRGVGSKARVSVSAAGRSDDVDSEVGRGSSFRVVLPIAGPLFNEAPSDTKPTREEAPPRGRILVIDDVPAIGRTIAAAVPELIRLLQTEAKVL